MKSKIAVIGNCQGEPLAMALAFLAPYVEIVSFPIVSLTERYGSFDGLVRALRDVDFAFVQEFSPREMPGGSSAELAAIGPHMIQYPILIFPAFHPDIVYVDRRQSDGTVQLLSSPTGHYNSSLILYGFRRGFTPRQTEALFHEDVFRRVGFLDAWAPAQETLLATARRLSMPIEREFLAWSRRGCFMHSINHPRLSTLVDIARLLLRHADLPARDEDPNSFIVDPLMRNEIWPVYPPIARLLGCSAGEVFKKGKSDIYLDLPEMIEQSFAIYAQYARDQFVCARVDAWMVDSELTAFTRERVSSLN